MKINSLSLYNIHGFKDFHITFDQACTVLIGDNRSGKTSILDGLAIAIGGFLTGFADVATRHIEKNDVRLEEAKQGPTTLLLPQYPCSVMCTGEILGEAMEWARSIGNEGGRTNRTEARDVIRMASELQNRIYTGSEEILPVFSYHGVVRTHSGKKRITSEHKEETLFKNRFAGYIDCLDPNPSEKLFIRWFERLTWQEFRDSKPSTLLTAVKKAVVEIFSGLTTGSAVTKLDFDPEDKLIVSFSDGSKLPFKLLSDGYQNIIRMVTDIAFRMALLNPALEEAVVKKTPGIVLIDEVDMNLHPHWQRHVIEDLKRVFPCVQFVLTTHSPFIVQALKPHELRSLDHTSQVEQTLIAEEVPPSKYVNKSLEEVAISMGVKQPERNQKLVELYDLTKRYYSLLTLRSQSSQAEEKETLTEKINLIKIEIDKRTSIFSDNVAYYAILELEREKIEGKRSL